MKQSDPIMRGADPIMKQTASIMRGADPIIEQSDPIIAPPPAIMAITTRFISRSTLSVAIFIIHLS